MAFWDKFHKFIMILIVIFTLSATGVFGLELNPDTFNIDVIEDIRQNYSLTVYYQQNVTPHNFTIYNVTFEPVEHFKFGVINNLSLNETKTLDFSVKTNETLEQDYLTRLKFFYLTNETKIPANRTITITGTGFLPIELDAFLNDTLLFYNNDTINHTITDIDNLEEFDVDVNMTHTFLIDELKNYSFVDEETLIGFEVEVKDNKYLQPTVNPSYYIPYTFSVESRHLPTNLEIVLTPPFSPINYNDKSSGVLILRPNETIYNLKMESDSWTTFSENNFDLVSEKIVVFTVNPQDITRTNQTGMDYEKVIKFTADNLDDMEKTFTIHINSRNFSQPDDDKPQIFVRLMTPEEQAEYCEDRDWDDPFCHVEEKNQTVIQYRDKIYTKNYTEAELDDLTDADEDEQDAIATLKTKVENMEKLIKDTLGLFGGQLGNLTDKVNQNLDKQDETHWFVTSVRRDWNLGGIGLGLLVIILVAFFVKNKRNTAEQESALEESSRI